MERITSAQPPPCMAKHQSQEMADMQGKDFPKYVCKHRKGMKRVEDSKETCKLPHRLIEKKRRDRINECIAQLKDLLPEHLKLTTLGHLEKAVVLELTLKHVKALSTLLEQQQQKIIALQIRDQSSVSSENSEEMFHSGFHVCAKKVLQYLANQGSSRDPLTPSEMTSHLHKVASEVLQGPFSPRSEEPTHKPIDSMEKPAGQMPKGKEGHPKNFVSVIQRTYPHGHGEQSGNDTDTDSGYGGEHEKRDLKAQRSSYYSKEGELKYALAERMAGGGVKQEGAEPQAKRFKSDYSEDESSSGQVVSSHHSYMSFSQHQTPSACPSTSSPQAAASWPMMEKCWFPRGMPILYPGMNVSAARLSPEKIPQNLVMSPRAGSPTLYQAPMDSPALLQALKQASP